MGSVSSYLRDVYHGIGGLLATILEGGESFKLALARIAAPRLPAPNPTTSFWQQQPPYPELVNIHSDQLPASTDIVIIGSGMSGASIAHTILNECRSMGISRQVVILEGRTTCSGATGRNGGHIKVAPVAEYAKLKKRFGAASAGKILAFYMKHLPFLLQLSKYEGLEKGEAREVKAVDAFTDPNVMRKAVEMLDVLRGDLPDIAEGIDVLDAEAIQDQFGFSSQFHGGMTYLSGAMWPYRFVTSTYASLLAKFPSELSIETGTMVHEIKVTIDSDTPFLLKTSRGDIKGAHVVHATDAFVANLVPGLVGKVFPVRGHMSAQRPGKSFPEYNGGVSWSLVGSKGYEYISQRPGLPDAVNGLGAEIMTGGGIFHGNGSGVDEVGQWGDDEIAHPIGSYLSGVLSVSFSSRFWGEDADRSTVKSMWTGSMGHTADMMPFIGRLSPSLTKRPVKTIQSSREVVDKGPGPSEWISTGFNGSGMVMTWLSGVATGLMVLGRENVKSEGQYWRPEGIVKDWLPDEFLCSPERVSRSSIYEFPKLV
ncbi:FAD dependent oxidoreductase-like protein [Leptodontidium sp. MPI-SDFR-AT-0119]|nr:FAD dependent oxidoreductase-like protein [Leptodontidium sp. MPI-SDFR-AT-0119]